ncbi:MAG: di-trans,poly-cis-decaprenylcistransferase [Proteobacteria bacterium]|nr:di-trans,poly-cis-decaprenylcistransferase [Pseudomonadota bacterium]
MPKHVAIIMDGNGRWAKARGFSRTKGHQKGVEIVKEVIKYCQENGIQVLTLFAFGVENWKRPSKEVRNLFRLFFLVLRKDLVNLNENNIQLRIIGDKTAFNRALKTAIQDAEILTQQNTGLVLNIAVNYSGRWDLINAIQKVLKRTSEKSEISEAQLNQELSLFGLPEPDLFIRTGGVQRISNFILWELAYTELYFTKTLWPDFTKAEWDNALADFALRERRFGLTGEQLG